MSIYWYDEYSFAACKEGAAVQSACSSLKCEEFVIFPGKSWVKQK